MRQGSAGLARKTGAAAPSAKNQMGAGPAAPNELVPPSQSVPQNIERSATTGISDETFVAKSELASSGTELAQNVSRARGATVVVRVTGARPPGRMVSPFYEAAFGPHPFRV